MRVSDCVACDEFPCVDVNHDCHLVPDIAIDPKKVRIVIVSEATPPDATDYYYAAGQPLFQETTVQAFRDAGASVSSVRDIVKSGVYLTTAVKCGKTEYGIKAGTIKECSKLLEEELQLFPDVSAILLMGDVAIKALNYVSNRVGDGRVIPSGSTYKIRSGEYQFQESRVFPSYLQAGPSFFIEKSKRRMIAEDIKEALAMLGK
jgi:uracil-DNA glycosylase